MAKLTNIEKEMYLKLFSSWKSQEAEWDGNTDSGQPQYIVGNMYWCHEDDDGWLPKSWLTTDEAFDRQRELEKWSI